MKVAVYTIALNEEKFIERWFNSAKDADHLLIMDTGSSDKTVECALALGIDVRQIRIHPWRFDDARNASLWALPNDIDYCIALDMDEILQPGWREELERAYQLGITRPGYRFIYSWLPDGSPGGEFNGIRIHTRFGYRWRYPIHEVPSPYGIEEKRMQMNFEIHHRPDPAKSRGQYLPLLAMAAREEPESERAAFYHARELYFHGRYRESAQEFRRYLDLAWWEPEIASAMNYLARVEPENAIEWCTKSMATYSGSREPMVILSRYYYNEQTWNQCLLWAEKALQIKEKRLDYIVEEFAWGAEVYDLAALAAHNLRLNQKAWGYGQMALDLNPDDQRLRRNLEFYRIALGTELSIPRNGFLQQKFFEMQLQENPDYVIEVGAHAAEFSITMANHLGVKSTAFEANVEVFKNFKDAIDSELVSYVNFAVSHKSELVTLKVHRNPLDGNNSIKHRIDSQIIEEYTVQAYSLDEYFKEFGFVSAALWIDAEGCNREVLIGAKETLKRCRTVFIETEDVAFWDDQWLTSDVESFLNSSGFEKIAEEPVYSQQKNIIFRKKSR